MYSNKHVLEYLQAIIPIGDVSINQGIGYDDSHVTFSFVLPSEQLKDNEFLKSDDRRRPRATLGNFIHYLENNLFAEERLRNKMDGMLSEKHALELKVEHLTKQVGRLELYKELYNGVMNSDNNDAEQEVPSDDNRSEATS